MEFATFRDGSLHVENVHIAGFSQNCLDASTGTSAGQLTVLASVFENCAATGVNLATSNGSVINAQLRDTRILNVTNGVNGQNGTRAVLDRVLIANASVGVLQSNAQAGGGSSVLVTNCTVDKATTALQSAAGAVMGATLSSFSNVNMIFNINGGVLFTGGDTVHFSEVIVGATSGNFPKT